MSKYRKKPVVIEAIQWDGSYKSWQSINSQLGSGSRKLKEEDDFLMVETLEGTMKANKGDYIIKGINGELYPCKPDIFEKTYEPVEDK